MKIRFIEETDQNNILAKSEDDEILHAVFIPYTQIQITKENQKIFCEYNYNVLKILENEIDIYVTIIEVE
ncbi:hypothetical protein [Clostridium sporogenes]|uniref:hypothetical protein n=1 Tax=Clostridium sporogenes TaxID=1509 RepID=UPI0006B27718|nr:hypothetical protein [Clostridium sporogenes]KOY66337.1 hypothetical protein AN649_08515 [Clostridium sporogenes]